MPVVIGRGTRSYLKVPRHDRIFAPIVWLGQSIRTTIVTKRYPALASACWMASLGDAVHRPQLIERVFCADIRARLGASGPIMLDSGGFTMLMQSRSLQVAEVARIYSHTLADLCISLDVPPRLTDDAATRHRKYKRTAQNLEILTGEIGPKRIVPVVHGLNLSEIQKNCSRIKSITSRPSIVCIGGMVPLLRKGGRVSHSAEAPFAFLASAISLIRSEFPTSLIHLLGAGSPGNVGSVVRCGADSTDSLAWRRAAGFGTIFLPGTSERFVAPRSRKRATSRPTLNPAECDLLMRCECPACEETNLLENRLIDLSSSYLARAAHNAFVIMEEARNSTKSGL